MKRICVYCGSRFGRSPRYREAASAFGEALAARGFDMVYGGGQVGLMGVVADAVLAGGGHVIGVIPERLMRAEVAHRGVSELQVVADMHPRKAAMAEHADGFVALPGGLGTFDELFEILTWAQLGKHSKPVGVLEVEGYFEPLRKLLEHAAQEQFVDADDRGRCAFEEDPIRLLERLFPAG